MTFSHKNVTQSHTDSQETEPLRLYLLMLTCVYKRQVARVKFLVQYVGTYMANKTDLDLEESLTSH